MREQLLLNRKDKYLEQIKRSVIESFNQSGYFPTTLFCYGSKHNQELNVVNLFPNVPSNRQKMYMLGAQIANENLGDLEYVALAGNGFPHYELHKRNLLTPNPITKLFIIAVKDLINSNSRVEFLPLNNLGKVNQYISNDFRRLTEKGLEIGILDEFLGGYSEHIQLQK